VRRQHRGIRSRFGEEKHLVLSLAYWDREKRELIARDCFCLQYFFDGEVLVDARKQGSLQQ